MALKLQNTLRKSVSLKSIGLHTGKMVSVTIKPAPENAGIIFKRIDVRDSESLIEANYRNVTQTNLGTVISNRSNVEVSTVEHLMAALWGFGVDNAVIEIDGPEVPIMDGSSAPFIDALATVGIRSQNALRKIIKIKDEIRVGDKSHYAKFTPSDDFSIKFGIEFADEAISVQKADFTLNEMAFMSDIADARTFCSKRDIEAMHAAGLALGGSLDNAIVVDGEKILNEEGLRFEDEFVRHKILDAVGDLFLIGGRIEGGFIGHKSGHSTNNEILHTLMENENAWELVEPVEPNLAESRPNLEFSNLSLA